jgi:hypothetical protein
MQPQTVLFFVVTLLFSIVVYSTLSLVGGWFCRRALHYASSQLSTQRFPLEAYQRFIAARAHILARTQCIRGVLSWGMVLFPAPFIIKATGIFPLSVYTPHLFLAAVILGAIAGTLAADRVGVNATDARRLFQIGGPLHVEKWTINIRKTLLRALPLLLIFSIFTLLFFFISTFNTATIILLLSLLAISLIFQTIVRPIFAVPFYRLTASLQQIDQTRWAELAPRITAWARLAGIEFASIQIEQTQLGHATLHILGIGKHPTFIMSEFLLSNTEWRQQDALIAIAIGMSKKQIARKIFLRNLFLLSTLITCLALIPLTAAFLPPIIPGVILAFTFMGLPILAILFLASYPRKAYYDVDCIAAHLTGDPYAVMVAYNIINALNGMSPTCGIQKQDMFNERMQKLSELALQPWQHAPQAYHPVPAVMPIQFASYDLTVSLSQTAQPVPVPGTPYESIE